MNLTDGFLFVLSASFPFCANVDALVALISQAAICKSTCFGFRVSRGFGSLDFMPHLMSARRGQLR